MAKWLSSGSRPSGPGCYLNTLLTTRKLRHSSSQLTRKLLSRAAGLAGALAHPAQGLRQPLQSAAAAWRLPQVATKRVKHAVKSDIPTTDDHVKKLVHIGKVTAQKLMNLRKAARAESMEMLVRAVAAVPEELNRVASVGVFRELVALADTQKDLKNKLRHLLDLSLEKWNQVAAHAQAAAVPDSKPRVWWPSSGQAGLLFPCKQGAVRMDTPLALLIRTSDRGEEQVISLDNLDAQLYGKVAELRESAKRSWLLPQHPGG
ncbi:uncharacterized protein HaLaN_12481 [Haematococcus lacustris]|uniref:Uncharacterized protein n=1 Tax=Haematococcus lacustris TaxID=44745 RepID=A0A699Z3H6_HAELA|nr:uncharacterized protein HaLaN_12481 [Haematococcus lacustris]